MDKAQAGARVALVLGIERIAEAIALTDRLMRQAGFARPRIAVAALNPHAGDRGAFGREENEVIAPAVAAARQQGIEASEQAFALASTIGAMRRQRASDRL